MPRAQTIDLSHAKPSLPESHVGVLLAYRIAKPVADPLYTLRVSPANRQFSRVEPRGLEPLASAVQRRHDTFLSLSEVCKIAANRCICVLALFPTFTKIYSGCWVVSARVCKKRDC